MENKFLEEIILVTRNKLFTHPHNRPIDEIKRILISLLSKSNPFKINKFSWPNSLLAMGIVEHYNLTKDDLDLKCLQKYFNLWIKKGLKINYIDQTVHGYNLIFLYELTNDAKYKKAADSILEYLQNYKKSKDGSLPYRRSKNNLVLIDSIGMISPFLCRYGKTFKNSDATDMGVRQIVNYLKKGIDEDSLLPYHAYNNIDNKKLGIFGWGRGVGFLLIGMIDSIEYIDNSHEYYNFITNKFIQIAESVLKYQNSDGSFSWQLYAKDGYSDSSATAIIAYAIRKAIVLNLLDDSYKKNCDMALSFILSSVKKGYVFSCSAESKGLGMYPQIYGTYPWSQGPATSLISLSLRNK